MGCEMRKVNGGNLNITYRNCVSAVLQFNEPSLGAEAGGLSQPDSFQCGKELGHNLHQHQSANISWLASTVTSDFPDYCF